MPLIDAEPIKKFIVDGLNHPVPLKAFGNDAIKILAEIEYAPTVDAVEVVRCRECTNGYESSCGSTGMRCKKWGCYDMNCDCRPDDFCSYGERRE